MANQYALNRGRIPAVNLNLNVRGLRPSATVAINERCNELIREGHTIYKLGLGQSPFPVPESVVDKLRTHADRPVFLFLNYFDPHAPYVPPDPEVIGVSRRQFFNRATVTLMSAGLGAFAAAAFVAFLWPSGTGGSTFSVDEQPKATATSGSSRTARKIQVLGTL